MNPGLVFASKSSTSISWHTKIALKLPSSAQALVKSFDNDLTELSHRVTELEDNQEELPGLEKKVDRLSEKVQKLETKMSNVLRQLGSFWAQRFLLSDVLGCCRALRKAIPRSNQQTDRFKVCR